MDKYMDFRLVSRMLHHSKSKLRSVPLSKGKIFESKEGELRCLNDLTYYTEICFYFCFCLNLKYTIIS